MKKGVLYTILGVLAAAVAFIYYYVTLPAINIHSSGFWIFHHGGDCGCDGGLYDPQGGKGYGGNGRRGPAFQPEGA